MKHVSSKRVVAVCLNVYAYHAVSELVSLEGAVAKLRTNAYGAIGYVHVLYRDVVSVI